MLFRNSFGLAYEQLVSQSPFMPVADRDLVMAMRLAMARRDSAEVRRVNRELMATNAEYTPGTTGIDRLYHPATMLLALGDTAAAIGQLDAALTALPRSRFILLKAIPQAGAIVPAMMLRAELAWRSRDIPTFQRWAKPAVALWSEADPELRRPVDVLKTRLRSPQP
jgi:hypothetical protein